MFGNVCSVVASHICLIMCVGSVLMFGNVCSVVASHICLIMCVGVC